MNEELLDQLSSLAPGKSREIEGTIYVNVDVDKPTTLCEHNWEEAAPEGAYRCQVCSLCGQGQVLAN